MTVHSAQESKQGRRTNWQTVRAKVGGVQFPEDVLDSLAGLVQRTGLQEPGGQEGRVQNAVNLSLYACLGFHVARRFADILKCFLCFVFLLSGCVFQTVLLWGTVEY